MLPVVQACRLSWLAVVAISCTGKQEAVQGRPGTTSQDVAVPDASPAWTKAIAAIQSADGQAASRLYRGIRLLPHPQLQPLGKNPATGLWEFEFAAPDSLDLTRQPPSRTTSQLRDGDEDRITFVLLPGGTLPAEEGQPPDHRHSVELRPFFLSKHELTRAQWRRLAGIEASAGTEATLTSTRLPADNIQWEQATEALSQHGMLLPSELQWEYACRAGSTTPWWTGRSADSMRGKENVESDTLYPVGSFADNAFGLHDMGGNISEWCRDTFGPFGNEQTGDGLRPTPAAGMS